MVLSQNIDKRIFDLLKYLPDSLKDYVKNLESSYLDKSLYKFFKSYLLPINFVLTTRGGWITKDGVYFIKSIGDSNYSEIRNRLIRDKNYIFDIKNRAFRQGFVLQYWKQPIQEIRFSTNFQKKVLGFALDKKELKSRRIIQSIEEIAIIYSILFPNLIYELSYVTYSDNKIIYNIKKFYNYQLFISELRSLI